MSTLLLRLAGPMQSWGTQSRFSMRDTGLEPSKSGVVGLLASALGRPRTAPLGDLAGLRLGVRVDREGRMACDFQTALEVIKADGSKPDTVMSNRYYLADADFLVALEGDVALLEKLHAALESPVWPLFLGRKAFLPGVPVWIPGGLRPATVLIEALQTWPWSPPRSEPPERLRLVLETADPAAGEPRQDVPVSFAERRFAVRFVRTDWLNTAALPKPAVAPEVPACS